ncbi:hypothetical protein CHLRE_15g637850v5 [Chlamydomonas reinhardtii]|uniref:RAP domain-containing protein n=1 Tax=Chlamydomonas reinhardtii TaxID=3055 RepID=A0A2K3CWQ5_CHLRE|nr:uncharacterized protein CHLRE_15g637850v5 [Chlamydomonas reinhardtii]PNW72708.1 hypothetical protein CHLRE_15g637850v5 [Chlamydomonas reinhardtii]
MLVMRASSGLVAGSFSGTCARSHSGHGYCNSSSARLQAPQPACALRRLFGRSDSDPSSPRAAAATSVPAHNSSSSSPLRVSTAAVLGGSSSSRLGRSVVQVAAGRGSSGGRAGGGSASGGGRGSGRDPADDMSVCQNLEDLQTFITRRLPVWEGKGDVITMCAAFNKCGKLESRAGANQTVVARSSIIAALAPAYLPLVPRMRMAVDCSLPLWALGKAGVSGDTEAQLAAALLERLVVPEVMGTAKPQELSNVMYALGKLKQDQQQRGSGWDPTSSPHLQTLASAVASRLGAAVGHGFKPQELSNILWACAKLGYADPGLLLPLAEAAATLSVSMKVQELANSLWAMEALGCSGLEYRSAVEALCGEVLQRLRIPELAAAFTPQHLSNILLALEGLQLGGKQAELVAAVAAEDVRRGFDGYVAQDLSNSAWALAKMGFGVGPEAPVEQRQWVSAAVDAAMRPGVMARATPQAWANLLYALSMIRHQPSPALLDAGAAAAMHRGNAQDCANTLWALAVLQLRHAGLEAAVVGRLGELLQRGGEALTEQGISNSLWAMAAFGNTCSPGMQQLAVQLARNAAGRRWKGFTDDGLRQLWQAQQELGGEVAAALGSSPGLQAAMDKSVETYRQDTKRLSETHKQLLAALRRLEGLATAGGLAVQSVQTGVVAPGVLTPVDVLVGLSDGRQVAVEWVTVVRFLSNRKQDPSAVNGSTVLRHRQLRRAFGEGGVLLVPYWEWDGLQTAEEQEAYLLRRLQQPAVAVETVTAGVVGGAAAVITAAPHQPATTTTTTTKGGGGSGSNPQQQLLVRPARRPEGGGGG